MTSHDNSGSAAVPSVGSLHRFENIEFDEVQGQLKVAGQVVALEPKPLLVLGELLRRVNEVVTKEELIDNVWDGRITVDHVLPNAISKLRSALGEAGAARIVTLPRVGYRLQGPVRRMSGVNDLSGS
jgi:eukaryotic-like serine/threonine-protein kinase